MVRDYIALDLEVDPSSFEVEITPEVGDGLDANIAEVRRQLQEAEQAQAQAAERSRSLVRQLTEKGLSGKDAAKVLGVTPQRVSQLLKSSGGGRTSHRGKVAVKGAGRGVGKKVDKEARVANGR